MQNFVLSNKNYGSNHVFKKKIEFNIKIANIFLRLIKFHKNPWVSMMKKRDLLKISGFKVSRFFQVVNTLFSFLLLAVYSLSLDISRKAQLDN